MSSAKPIVFKTLIYRLAHLLDVHYLEVPPDIISQLGGSFSNRLLCSINNSTAFQAGLVALGNGSAYISINNKRLKQFRLKMGDEIEVSLEKDTSKFGMEVPEELAELLEQDPEGKDRFDKLTPGKQRYIIQYVASVKSSQLRIDRAIFLISNLKRLPIGKESFREILGLEKRQ
jgi:hypothetical protein